MQKRARRPQGIHTRKISVSITEDDLALITRRAKRLHRGNVSAVVHEMVAALRREEALDRLLASFDGAPPTPEELHQLREEIAAAPTGRKRRPAA
jgi:hypothetical protein